MRRGFMFRSGRSFSRVAKDRLSQARRRASAQHLLRFEPLEDRRLLASDGVLVSAAPVVNAGPDQTVFEGATFAQAGSFIDTDSQAWTARVDYGDGSGSQALALNADKTFQLSHTFPDDGRYTVSVAVTDGEKVVGSDTLLVTVQNVIPSLFVRGQRTQPEGTTFTLVDMGMITDPGFDNASGSTSERFTFSVDWGDGTPVDTGNATTDVVGGPGRVTRATFDGTHQYESVGKFTVSITAKDDNLGTSVTRFMTIETKNPQPTITALDLDQTTIDEGGTVTLSGSYADASTVDTHTLVINWGDGDTGNVAVNAADKTFTATHLYRNNPAAAPFAYTIGATIRDSAGGTGTSSVDVTVNNVAPELEFYLVEPNIDADYPLKPPVGRSGRPEVGRQSYSIAAVNEFDPLFDDIYAFCEAQEIEIDTLIHEDGAAQMEINLIHGDAMSLADQVFMFKRTAREAAFRHKMYATFMSKPMAREPGSAMHIHQSVVDVKTGNNVFSDKDGNPSALFFAHIAGLQKYLPSAMALFAPNVNAFRRIILRHMAPINTQWGYDNRTAGLRVPISNAENRRIENRLGGADANPYLAIAASLACGYLGMIEGLKPSEPVSGSAYELPFGLPRSLEESVRGLRDCRQLIDLLGERFVLAYTAVKESEHDTFLQVISSWEREHLLLNV